MDEQKIIEQTESEMRPKQDHTYGSAKTNADAGKKTRKKERKSHGRFTESVFWKIWLYFWLVVCTVATAGAILAVVVLADIGLYTDTPYTFARNMMQSEVVSRFYELCDQPTYESENDWLEALKEDSEDSSISYSVVKSSWGTYTIWSSKPSIADDDTVFTYTWTTEIYVLNEYVRYQSGETAERVTEPESIGEYTITAYVGPEFYDDVFGHLWNLSSLALEWKWGLIAIAVGGVLLVLLNFAWILCLAGHKRGREGITPSVLNGIPLDLLTAVMGAAALYALAFLLNEFDLEIEGLILACMVLILETIWCTLYCQELATRLKIGRWWRNTIVFRVLRLLWRVLRWLGHALAELVHVLPYIWVIALVVAALVAEDFLIFISCCDESVLFLFWLLGKLVACGLVFYCAVMQVRIRRGTQRIAQGDLSAKVDRNGMALLFDDTADDINRIGDGLSVAVEKRMQSERLKTELITNVSHDIKTPLTSIINYATLCGEEAGGETEPDRAKLAEYSEVLLRQSQRLKKLLENLVEASKATTGNLEVNLQPCELGVLLTQAAGEYGERLQAQRLDLHITTPEEPVRILADGRHLWRIFDNLLGNICKYAQEGSRVYLNMAQEGDQAVVIFRNMSKYELNISAEELTERFVRGDSSRHMEGSGLGLSIAQSLVELQHGTMEIITDGDLFKVTLRFPVTQ